MSPNWKDEIVSMCIGLKSLDWFQKLILLLFGAIIFRNSAFFEIEMIGTYVSNAEKPIAEMPGKGTKLFIHNDGKYTSSSSAMGKGIYRMIRACNRTESRGKH